MIDMKNKGSMAFAILFLVIFVILIIGYTSFTQVYAGSFPTMKSFINKTAHPDLGTANTIIRRMEIGWSVFPIFLLLMFVILWIASTQKNDARRVIYG